MFLLFSLMWWWHGDVLMWPVPLKMVSKDVLVLIFDVINTRQKEIARCNLKNGIENMLIVWHMLHVSSPLKRFWQYTHFLYSLFLFATTILFNNWMRPANVNIHTNSDIDALAWATVWYEYYKHTTVDVNFVNTRTMF